VEGDRPRVRAQQEREGKKEVIIITSSRTGGGEKKKKREESRFGLVLCWRGAGQKEGEGGESPADFSGFIDHIHRRGRGEGEKNPIWYSRIGLGRGEEHYPQR